MNDVFPSLAMIVTRCFAVTGLAVLVAITGCERREVGHVDLKARAIPGEPLTRLEVEAQVSAPLAGLKYKWFAVSGECEPQESNQPKMVFKFPEGVRQDRISVEVWRGDNRIAENDLRVKYDAEADRRKAAEPEVQITVTKIPPAEQGGPETNAIIAGNVTGKFPPDSRVLVYVRAYGSWFIQPLARSMHSLRPDNTWETWTHTGIRYAALLVTSDYEPLNKIDMLPEASQSILARTIVDGAKAQGAAATPVSSDVSGTPSKTLP